MDEKYFAKKIEAEWQKKWSEERTFSVSESDDKPKFYQLEMLPYPSGNLHMGHVRNYAVGDAIAWYKRLKGFNVLHPIGWDSFGQPAEDAAVKRGVNPREWTEKNIEVMRGQLQRLGISYDWERQIYAHKPEFYKFDQWFFLKMLEKGLAYKKLTQVNWCEHDQATLSNEQASGGICWRCGNPVSKKDLDQWFFKTTAYVDELLNDMAEIEKGWPTNVLKRQSDWISRSEGAFVNFTIKDSTEKVRVFTTRIDTIYGANAVVIAAEHPVLIAHSSSLSDQVLSKVQEIRAAQMNPTDHESEAHKDGINTGIVAVNPFSGEELPIWAGNYVMMEYGTGAVMSVPAHDQRDLEFAQKFDLPVKKVIRLADEDVSSAAESITEAASDYGILMNSGEWNGKSSEDAKREMTEFAEANSFGESATTYRLRDWGVSRQRFWGSPIPIIYCEDCGAVPEKFENLPVELPETAPFTGTGESPLAKVPEFYETTCPNCGEPAKRETDTMDTFVDSSWYYFRYLDPTNSDMPFSKEKAAYWTPVDQYIGGDDHAVMHLIYTRFWTKMMRDIGLVKFNEPITRLLTQGMVVGETFFADDTGKRIYYPPAEVVIERDAKGKLIGAAAQDGTMLKYAIERMSKSKGNGVDPDEMIDIYGADAARLFILFAAPVENELVWNEAGIEGAVRFLQRVWRFVWKWHGSLDPQTDAGDSAGAKALRRKTHQTIKRVDDALDSLQFNTPVAALMEFLNSIHDIDSEPATATDDEKFAIKEALTSLVLMLAPFAPHTAESLYAAINGNNDGLIANQARFPEYDAEISKEDEIEIPIQVNGKLRSRVHASPETAAAELEKMALADEKVLEHTDGKQIVKVIVVPKRLVNIVVK